MTTDLFKEPASLIYGDIEEISNAFLDNAYVACKCQAQVTFAQQLQVKVYQVWREKAVLKRKVKKFKWKIRYA
ncbi:hypothetical protein Tco_0030111 [Tanacetum coccineum]